MIVRITILVIFLLLAGVKEIEGRRPVTLSFSELVQEKLYVDKTGLLIDFINGEIDTVVYLAAPRQFGKTTNNFMIKDFFNVSFEEDGYTLIANKTKDPRYQKFKAMKNLKVVQDEKFFEEHFGNYIVVYIELGEFTITTMEKLEKALSYSVTDAAFGPFKRWWLYYSGCKTKICRNPRTICCQLLTDIFEMKFDDIEDWSTALACLFDNLRKHYQKEVILVVDEFDRSVLASLKYLSYDSAMHILDYLSVIFGGLSKSMLPQTGLNPVFRTLFTGITPLPLGKSDRMDKVEIYYFFEKNPLSEYYGFSQAEVDELLQRYNLQDRKEALKNFYDGYKIIGSDRQIYNPLSLVQFLKSEGKIESYWQRTGTTTYWFQFCHDPEVFKNIELLGLGKNVSLGIRINEQVWDFTTMKEVLSVCDSPRNESRPEINIHAKHRIYFFKYLLQEGYLSPADSSGENNLFAAPNAETLEVFSEIYTEYASRIVNINLISVAQVFWTMADTCSIKEEFVKELSENFHRLVQNRIQNKDDYHYDEQTLRSMVFFSCKYKALSRLVRREFVFAEIPVEYEAFINIKWSDTDTIRYELKEKNYGKAGVYIKLNGGETIVIIEFKATINVDEGAEQVLSYRPRMKDQKKCKKLVLVWLAVPPCPVRNDSKNIQMKLENEIEVSVGCYVFENYDPENPVARICADPNNPITPGIVPKNYFLKPVPVE